jgi:ABC-type transporter Mla subunit MlaD
MIVGIFVIVAICALVWLIFMFGDFPTYFNRARSFQVFVQFRTAPRVDKGTPVRFCGYPIGSVIKVMAPEIREEITRDTGKKADKDDGEKTDKDNGKKKKEPRKYHQALVILGIRKKYVNIPSNVEVKLMMRGLGSSYIELRVDPNSLPAPPLDPDRRETQFLKDGMWLQGSTGQTSEFFPEESQKKLDKLVDRMRTVLNNANKIVGDPNSQENVKKILANVSNMTEQATQTLENLEKFFIAGTGVSDELSKTVAELRKILEKVNNGEGTAAKFINDGKVYEGLADSTEQLDMLLQELRLLINKIREKGLLAPNYK